MQPSRVKEGKYLHDKDKLLILGFMGEIRRSAFVEGYVLLVAGAVTRVSRMKNFVLIGGDLLFFFFERDQSGARVSEQICLLLF